MKHIFIGTGNIGKQLEIKNFAEKLGIKDFKLLFPDARTRLEVEEIGETYEENALLKARAYLKNITNESIICTGDDSGIRIPALNNEPGVHSKRWAGHIMSDEEILDYCLGKMSGLKGDNRKAVFETVIVAVKKSGEYRVFKGEMWGRILEKPRKIKILDGFPFRETFWVDEVNKVWEEAVALSMKDRRGFMTNREKAFQQLFMNI